MQESEGGKRLRLRVRYTSKTRWEATELGLKRGTIKRLKGNKARTKDGHQSKARREEIGES